MKVIQKCVPIPPKKNSVNFKIRSTLGSNTSLDTLKYQLNIRGLMHCVGFHDSGLEEMLEMCTRFGQVLRGAIVMA